MAENRDQPEWMRGPVAWMAQNPVAANLLLLIVVIAGLFAIQTLDKEVFPSFPTETFTITVPYPGSSPEEVERGIILRVEEASATSSVSRRSAARRARASVSSRSSWSRAATCPRP
jgi:multidrug efflux pump subunit AcrB